MATAPSMQINRLSSPTIRGQITRLRKLVEQRIDETLARHSTKATTVTHDADGNPYSEPMSLSHLRAELTEIQQALSVLDQIQTLTQYRRDPLCNEPEEKD